MNYVDHYAQRQVIARWLVAILVLYQFLFNADANEAMRLSTEAGSTVITGGMLTHGFSGVIGCVMVWPYHAARPRRPAAARRRVAADPDPRGTHWAFYVVLIAMPVVGLLAILTVSPTLAGIHALYATCSGLCCCTSRRRSGISSSSGTA